MRGRPQGPREGLFQRVPLRLGPLAQALGLPAPLPATADLLVQFGQHPGPLGLKLGRPQDEVEREPRRRFEVRLPGRVVRVRLAGSGVTPTGGWGRRRGR
jgi:hypothetical protein